MIPLEEAALVALLNHRFGDGLVYIQGRDDRRLFKKARSLGLVSEEGYLTPAGYRFCHARGPLPRAPGRDPRGAAGNGHRSAS